MDREKALDMALKQIEKQYGAGALMKLGEDQQVQVPAIPTGALSLDLALGVGGLPRGRVVELFGPEASGKTSIALHVIAEAQKLGGIAAFIDAEHALDPPYARAIGVDVDELLVSQPDTGEQALEITDMLVRSGAVDIIAIDSVAALVPRAEIEGEMGDSHVGLQARLMSQAMRKLSGSISKSKTTVVFINQLREKIGVMFGCASGRTRVTLADGSHETIGRIVNEKMDVEVLSYDQELGKIVPRKVTDWFDNGETDGFLHFTIVRAGGGVGHYESHIEYTPNHLIMTPAGWREAQELEVGDRVVQAVPHHLSDFQWEVLLGGLMGDGALSPSRSGRAARFRWGHGADQVEYADWKASLFANINVSRHTNDKGAVFFDAQPLAELAELREAVYWEGSKVLSHDYLKRLTPLSLAIWYMDDGSFRLRAKGLQERTKGGSGRSQICVQALEPTSRARLAEYLRDTWDLDVNLSVRGKRQIPYLVFNKDATARFHALIAPFVHPSMQYKLLPKYRGRFAIEPVLGEMRFEPVSMEILKIDRREPEGDNHRYDIEVDGTHNYFADGVMVHNSPETTPGGRALKFYSSVRLDVRRIESLKDGSDFVGSRVRVKVVKNKCLAAGTRVFDPSTGRTHTIEEIVNDGEGTSVWAIDKRGELHVRPIVARMDQGEQEVITLSFRGSSELTVTTDHRVLTDRGWREAGDLQVGDRVARPRRAGSFGEQEPVPVDHARLLGYLIGDGYVGGKTPIAFINTAEVLHEDVALIAGSLGCRVQWKKKDGIYASISHRKGEKNGVLELARWAGIWGHLAPDKTISPHFFGPEVSEEVLGNLLFGIWESDGWISREQTGGIRCGFATTSEQLAQQIHWLLLRWGIGSAVKVHEPGSRRSLVAGHRIQGNLPCWQVRISGIDNVRRFAAALPMWGPKGQTLQDELADPELAKHRGSQMIYLPPSQTEPVIAYLKQRGITAKLAASMIGLTENHAQGGWKSVLGQSRLRRDRLAQVATALDSQFLRDVLDEDVYYDRIWAISEPKWKPTYDIEVEDLHNLVAEDVVVHNCASPFRQAEFDILFGEGISKEGAILDVGLDAGIVNKAGAWYQYGDDNLGQGRENARVFLKENDDIAREIEKKAKEALGLIPTNTAEGEDPEADDGDEGDADDES